MRQSEIVREREANAEGLRYHMRLPKQLHKVSLRIIAGELGWTLP